MYNKNAVYMTLVALIAIVVCSIVCHMNVMTCSADEVDDVYFENRIFNDTNVCDEVFYYSLDKEIMKVSEELLAAPCTNLAIRKARLLWYRYKDDESIETALMALKDADARERVEILSFITDMVNWSLDGSIVSIAKEGRYLEMLLDSMDALNRCDMIDYSEQNGYLERYAFTTNELLYIYERAGMHTMSKRYIAKLDECTNVDNSILSAYYSLEVIAHQFRNAAYSNEIEAARMLAERLICLQNSNEYGEVFDYSRIIAAKKEAARYLGMDDYGDTVDIIAEKK